MIIGWLFTCTVCPLPSPINRTTTWTQSHLIPQLNHTSSRIQGMKTRVLLLLIKMSQTNIYTIPQKNCALTAAPVDISLLDNDRGCSNLSFSEIWIWTVQSTNAKKVPNKCTFTQSGTLMFAVVPENSSFGCFFFLISGFIQCSCLKKPLNCWDCINGEIRSLGKDGWGKRNAKTALAWSHHILKQQQARARPFLGIPTDTR